MTSKTLFKALVEEGFAEGGKRNHTKAVRIGGRQRHFLVLNRQKVDTLIAAEDVSQVAQDEFPIIDDDEPLPFLDEKGA